MGRIIGIDFGLKRIGLARSDPLKIIASPLPTVQCGKSLNATIDLILAAIAPLNEVELIVVGLPLLLSGQDSEMTKMARGFAKALEEKSQLKVILWDERLTSKIAEREMSLDSVNRKKRAQKVDQISALLILQSYLLSC